MHHFGLGQVRGKLAMYTVGGMKRYVTNITNSVYEFDEVIQSWKQSIPPMPTARFLPAVLSHHSTLTVTGGSTGFTLSQCITVVEKKPPSGTQLSHSHSLACSLLTTHQQQVVPSGWRS